MDRNQWFSFSPKVCFYFLAALCIRMAGFRYTTTLMSAMGDEGSTLMPNRKETMSFTTEGTGYQKTILSDLQGAWEVFRQSVVDSGGFENCDRVLFHTDEAMSWESVRNLNRMLPLILIIRNLCMQGGASHEIMSNLEEMTNILEETLAEFLC